jgi:hypothetical protein
LLRRLASSRPWTPSSTHTATPSCRFTSTSPTAAPTSTPWDEPPTQDELVAVLALNVSLAEVRAVAPGITLKKKKVTCIKRKRGRCVRKKVKKPAVFWITTPPCPPSGKLSMLAFYGYDDPIPDITKTVEIPCPNFKA